MSHISPSYLPELDLDSVTEWRVGKSYRVLLHNDDYTPMDFVVEVLCRFFAMSQDEATEIMLQVHYNGKAICAIYYTADVAEMKVNQVCTYARENEHPLLCTMEVIE